MMCIYEGVFGDEHCELLDFLDPTVGRVVTHRLPRLFWAINRDLNSDDASCFHPRTLL